MKTIAKIIYTVIVCKFLIGIRERLMTMVPIDPTKYLLIEYFPEDDWALLYGYADNLKKINQLMCDMRDNGFDKMPYSRMTVVHPLGNGMFKNILTEEHIGPFRLRGITKGRWYNIAQKYGMRRDVIDSMCGMK